MLQQKDIDGWMPLQELYEFSAAVASEANDADWGSF
jgi:hypothetical protein